MLYHVTLTLTRAMLGTNPQDPYVLDTHIIKKQQEIILEKNKVNRAIDKNIDQANKYLAAELPEARRKEDIEAALDKLETILGYELDAQTRADVVAGKLDPLRESLKTLQEKGPGTTVFFWNKEKSRPMIGDHMIYGFMKAAAEAIGRCSKEKGRGKILESIGYTQSIINQHVRLAERYITFDADIVRAEDGTPQYLQRSLRAETAQGPRITLAKSEIVPEGAKLEFTMRVMDGSPIDDIKVLKRIFDYGDFVGLGQWRSAGHGMFNYTISLV